ncbi:alpha/beta fold hydrolase [Streptomyces sp. NPDC058067]|uniref:alpha/beta fold hydrolase n=1 Tax=Streptomyces sp. NPDC058067 TaxID=3346324 RepID=UPI0036E7A913
MDDPGRTAVTPSLHHVVTGPSEAPPLLLGPSLGTSTVVWDPQLASLSRHFRVIRFDLPGHGGSPTRLLPGAAAGATTVDDLATLVLRLADGLSLSRFHYAGISLGGAIGAHLALTAPERVVSLALVCSSAHFGGPGPWRERAALVRAEGTGPLLAATPGRWFASDRGPATDRQARLLDGLATCDPEGYAACCDALASYDVRARLREITTPTLVIGGTQDLATPLDHAEELAAGIPHATLTTVRTGHLADEQPHAVATALLTHLSARPASPDLPTPNI